MHSLANKRVWYTYDSFVCGPFVTMTTDTTKEGVGSVGVDVVYDEDDARLWLGWKLHCRLGWAIRLNRRWCVLVKTY